MDGNHGELDHVRRAALDRRVYCVALGASPHGSVGLPYVTDVPPPAGYGFHVTVLSGKLDRVVHVTANSRELREILIDDVPRLLARNVQSLREPEGADPVRDS